MAMVDKVRSAASASGLRIVFDDGVIVAVEDGSDLTAFKERLKPYKAYLAWLERDIRVSSFGVNSQTTGHRLHKGRVARDGQPRTYVCPYAQIRRVVTSSTGYGGGGSWARSSVGDGVVSATYEDWHCMTSEGLRCAALSAPATEAKRGTTTHILECGGVKIGAFNSFGMPMPEWTNTYGWDGKLSPGTSAPYHVTISMPTTAGVLDEMGMTSGLRRLAVGNVVNAIAVTGPMVCTVGEWLGNDNLVSWNYVSNTEMSQHLLRLAAQQTGANALNLRTQAEKMSRTQGGVISIRRGRLPFFDLSDELRRAVATYGESEVLKDPELAAGKAYWDSLPADAWITSATGGAELTPDPDGATPCKLSYSEGFVFEYPDEVTERVSAINLETRLLQLVSSGFEVTLDVTSNWPSDPPVIPAKPESPSAFSVEPTFLGDPAGEGGRAALSTCCDPKVKVWTSNPVTPLMRLDLIALFGA